MPSTTASAGAWPYRASLPRDTIKADAVSEENDFRPLEERERRLLERLLEHHPFDGRDELRKQLESTTARLIAEHHDNYGSIELRVAEPTPARVRCRVPVEAEYPDQDGVPVWVLLYVNRDGAMCDLKSAGRMDGLAGVFI